MKKLLMLGLLTAGLLTACGAVPPSTPINQAPPAIGSEPVTETPKNPSDTASINVILSGSNAVVTWIAVADAKSYKIDRKVATGAYVEVGSVDTPALTFTDKALPAGTYTYRVRTVNSTGVSAGKESVASTVIAAMPTKWIGSLTYDNALQIDDLFVDFLPVKSIPTEPPQVLSKLGSSSTWTYQSATDVKKDNTTNKITIVYRELDDKCKTTTQLVKIDAVYDPVKNTITGTLRSDGIAYSYTGKLKMRPASATDNSFSRLTCVGL
ncbi:hypothetical protein [Deinococcus sp.]|uniref:hypothetical protein n=1 Tax=Deinococcus sp. TaxID=47478 RepID=UPI0025FD5015|nr:hypothetical protein [Deinococcus sp.]